MPAARAVRRCRTAGRPRPRTARGRLVEDQHRRFRRDRAGDRDKLPLRRPKLAEIPSSGKSSSTAAAISSARRRIVRGVRNAGEAPEHSSSRIRFSATVESRRSGLVGLLVDGRDAQHPRRLAGRRSIRTCPPPRPEPASACKVPDRIFTSVDLPAPLAPISATISPRETTRSAASSACVAAKLLSIRRRLSPVGRPEFMLWINPPAPGQGRRSGRRRLRCPPTTAPANPICLSRRASRPGSSRGSSALDARSGFRRRRGSRPA